MDEFCRSALSNATWAAALALLAAIGSWLFRRRPAVSHLLWLLVLLKLLVPSFYSLSLPQPFASPRDPSAITTTISSEPAPAPVFTKVDAISEPAIEMPRTAPRAPVFRHSLPWSWQSVLLALWLTGACVWWSVLIWNDRRFRRLMRSVRPAEPEIRERIGRVAGRLGVRTPPAAWLLPARVPPMVWVPLVSPPRLILPEELWGKFDDVQQDAILIHELAHLKRRDHWVRRLQALACGLYWWDPIAWWAGREVERAEEQCCDAWVLWLLPSAAAAYAEALVATTAFLSHIPLPLPLGASGLGRTLPLKRRLQMIVAR